MARYTGPKARINRRLGGLIYESSGASRGYERRQQPPGMHTRGKRPSNYGQALYEKQKIKGNTGEQMLLLCERRLDNIVRRAGFAKTRPQARQGVAHGHFHVNGVRVDKPSIMVRPGDVITVRDNEKLRTLYKGVQTESGGAAALDWLDVDESGLMITVQGLPSPDDISLPVDVNMVVEFLSR